MKKTAIIILLFSLFAVGVSFAGENVSANRDKVNKFFDKTKEMLKKEDIDDINKYFSSQYYGGYQELENRLTRRWKRQNITNIEFSINNILKNDGLYLVQIKWDKAYLDRKGHPRKSSGVCDVTLKPYKKSYRILNIRNLK